MTGIVVVCKSAYGETTTALFPADKTRLQELIPEEEKQINKYREKHLPVVRLLQALHFTVRFALSDRTTMFSSGFWCCSFHWEDKTVVCHDASFVHGLYCLILYWDWKIRSRSSCHHSLAGLSVILHHITLSSLYTISTVSSGLPV